MQFLGKIWSNNTSAPSLLELAPTSGKSWIRHWNENNDIFTAHKRSLRRLCFYRCLSVHGGACMVALRGVCVVAPGGHAWLLPGGTCGCSQGGHAWLLLGGGGHVWLLPWGCAWLPCGGMHGCSQGGMHGCSQGACMVALGQRGHAWLLLGGMCGCSWGACVVSPGGCAWLLLGGMYGCSQGCVCGCSGGHAWVAPGGACIVATGGHTWLLPGGACVVALGECAWLLLGGCVWLLPGGHAWDTMTYGDTINEQAVRILLECILVSNILSLTYSRSRRQNYEMYHKAERILERSAPISITGSHKFSVIMKTFTRSISSIFKLTP